MLTGSPEPMPSTLGPILFEAPGDARTVLDKPCFKERRNRVSDQAKVDWATVAGPAGDALYAALDIEMDGVLVGGWKGLDELQVYGDPKRYPSSEPTLVPLARHTMASIHTPGVEILVNAAVIGKIVLDMELALVLDAVVLVIRDGRIMAIQSGYCTIACNLRFGNTVLLPVIESPKFMLPGAIDLGEGIPIPGLRRAV